MTTYVLVAGGHMGGWLWQDVVDRLRERGAEAYPATLTGMGDRRHLAGPGTDLETHIEDLVQLIDHLDAPEVVLVAHCHGSFPALGAADRRPERVSRIVYVSAPLPMDGFSVHGLVDEFEPDPAVRDGWRQRAEQAEDGWRIPPPSPDDVQARNSVAGVPADALARLVRLAAPQPLGPLTQPLRLSGAAAELPTSGVFCTGTQMSIAMVESLVRSGDPRFRVLTEPHVTFFELDTGHWPMLSAPDELAGLLLRAAAGEGQRVTA
ncbi:alpha/beta hydrolase [Streptomyces sp. RPA4-5]|uniref:alpha/beta fold hydrolase n=1 Tax=Streptomyces TaxID=1883 RepID=UPI00143ECF6C|nr:MULTISPECIES: alpha/beta fold hydrolase [Streptomyces]MCX4633954.1 alpha/beta hydrolase [Streptomyces platensis]QIY55149.1 alpha/beta hydrolase [Streptomyces sp. RPA4-5]WJY37843.1 alpha/beta fold hydrolase [Streptomyces sp. P9-2B-2]